MLDKSKPYGEIIGSTDGSKYDQNGRIYNGQGELMTPVNDAIEVIEEEKKKLGRPRKEQ